MKRSEMVQELAEFVALFEDQSPEACINLADQYLRVIEEKGMLPPPNKKSLTINPISGNIVKDKNYSWEPENNGKGF